MSRRIKLMSLGIENFKGIKRFNLEPKGRNAEISAENRKGKTTTYDAFLWLLFGKDSKDRKEFDLRPLDDDNELIPNIVTRITAGIEIDGVGHFFRKEHHENILKGVLTGYESKYWIDEVPKKAGEYQACIEDIIDERIFKLLTNLRYFNELHWQERRKILMEVAGEIRKPQGFEELLEAAAKYRNLDEYKKMLTDQKKRHKEEREDITPRIDEILRNLEQPEGDTEGLTDRRRELKSKLSACKQMRQDILDREKQRQAKINQVNLLEVEKHKREAELSRPDPEKIKALREEEGKLLEASSLANREVVKLNESLQKAQSNLEANKNQLAHKQDELDEARQDKTKLESRKESDVCGMCGQRLPDNMLAEAAEKKAKKVKQLEQICASSKLGVEQITKAVDGNEKVVADFESKVEAVKAKVKELEQKEADGVREIQTKIKALQNAEVEIDPASDQKLLDIITRIKELKAEIGEPPSEQLQAIENNIADHEAELEKVNEQLAQADRLDKDRARKKELEEREKELAQLLADADRMLDMVQQYKAAESDLITSVVNDKFRHVTFKMFKTNLNGSIEECCDTLLEGKPYRAWSSGEEIFGGLDIVETLSEHYDTICPLFIDHRESLTLPIQTKAQTITLKVVEGQKELKVEVEKEKAKAVA